jgi:hypothetical protein
MQWKVKVKASQYNTKDCNCFITLNENESETKSISFNQTISNFTEYQMTA